MGKIVIKVFTR